MFLWTRYHTKGACSAALSIVIRLLLMQTPAEGVQRAPWSAGQEKSDLGPRCEIVIDAKVALGELQQWDCQTYSNN